MSQPPFVEDEEAYLSKYEIEFVKDVVSKHGIVKGDVDRSEFSMLGKLKSFSGNRIQCVEKLEGYEKIERILTLGCYYNTEKLFSEALYWFRRGFAKMKSSKFCKYSLNREYWYVRCLYHLAEILGNHCTSNLDLLAEGAEYLEAAESRMKVLLSIVIPQNMKDFSHSEMQILCYILYIDILILKASRTKQISSCVQALKILTECVTLDRYFRICTDASDSLTRLVTMYFTIGTLSPTNSIALRFLHLAQQISDESFSLYATIESKIQEFQHTNADSVSDFEDVPTIDTDTDDWGSDFEESSIGERLGLKEEKYEDLLDAQVFPEDLKFFKSQEVSKKEDTVVPSSMYSISLKESKDFQKSSQLIEWLETLTGKEESGELDPDSLISKFEIDLQYIDAFSIKWALSYYEACFTLRNLAKIAGDSINLKCHDLLCQYFNALPEGKMSENIDSDDLKKHTALYNISLEILRIAAVVSFKIDLKQFSTMIQVMKDFRSPKNHDEITLVEMEALCHNIKLVEPDTEKQRIIKTCLQMYEKYNMIAEQQNIPISSYYQDKQGPELASLAILILHYYVCNISPITGEQLFTDRDTNLPDFSMYAENIMLDIDYRLKQLQKLYRKIKTLSILKAKISLALSQYWRAYDKRRNLAEKGLLECIYIYESSNSYLKNRSCLSLSDFGTKALIEYGEVLVEKEKYIFARHAFAQAVRNYQLIHFEYDYLLVNKLAVLSAKHNDWEFTIKYVLILLNKAKKEKNFVKVVFFSEKLSKEYMERGEFRNAELYITECVKFLQEMMDKSLKSDMELKLQLKLADLFLQSYYFERGIDLLAKLMELNLSHIQKCRVLVKLSEAYLKKRWLKESEIVLEKLGKLIENHQIPLNRSVFDHVKVLVTCSRLYFKKRQFALALFCINSALSHCNSSNLPQFAVLFRLKGKIFRFLSQSQCCDGFPLRLNCDDSMKNTLIRQFSIRKLEMNSPFFDESYLAMKDQYINSYECLKECLKYFEKSKFCYHAINDGINVAKMQLFISGALISYMFNHVAILESETKIQAYKETPELKLSDIEEKYLNPAVEFSVSTSSLILSLEAYITFSELRYLQGRQVSSQRFWTEGLHILFTLFMKGTTLVVQKGAPPQFIERIYFFLSRLSRLMFCFDSKWIIENLAVIDAFLILDMEISQVLSRQNELYESNIDDDNTELLLQQNKVYQALPQSSSVNKSKSLPFLRRKKRSVRKIPLLKRSGLSHSSDSNDATSMVESILNMNEKVNERVWGCFFRMKKHERSYSSQNITRSELNRRNQESMRRLYDIMNSLRADDSIKDGIEKKYYNSSSSEELVKGEIVDDVKLRTMSSVQTDFYLISALYRSVGSQNKPEFIHANHRGRRHPSLTTDISVISRTTEVAKDRNVLDKVVYLVKFDDVVMFFIPNIRSRGALKFGGRDLDTEESKVWFDGTSNDYLFTLLTSGRRDSKKSSTDGFIKKLRNIFQCIPFGYRPQQGRVDNIEKKKTSKFCPLEEPLCLITSKSLTLIPWEMLFDHYMSRYFTLDSLIQKKSSASACKLKPSYFAFYSEDETKYIRNLEQERKIWLYRCLKHDLGLEGEKPSIQSDLRPNLPIHTPLIKYGKNPKSKSYRNRYKHLCFVQMSKIASNSHNVLTLIDSRLNHFEYPVFIFTLADLLDLSDVIHCLMKFRSDITFLFVPEKDIIRSVKFLLENSMHQDISQPHNLQSGRVDLKQLHQYVNWLQEQMHIPVVMFSNNL